MWVPITLLVKSLSWYIILYTTFSQSVFSLLLYAIKFEQSLRIEVFISETWDLFILSFIFFKMQDSLKYCQLRVITNTHIWSYSVQCTCLRLDLHNCYHIGERIYINYLRTVSNYLRNMKNLCSSSLWCYLIIIFMR